VIKEIESVAPAVDEGRKFAKVTKGLRSARSEIFIASRSLQTFKLL